MDDSSCVTTPPVKKKLYCSPYWPPALQSDERLCFENSWHHFACDHSIEGLCLKFRYSIKLDAGRTILQAVAIVKTIPFLTLEGDFEAEQT